MKGQPFESACRGGSLLVSESRVMRRGTVAWALWRSQITGVGCMCPAAGEDVTACLHLRDGRRFAVEEIAPRECFQLFELLGYEPEQRPHTSVQSDDEPLVIDLGDGHTRVVGGSRSIALEQDLRPLWSVPHDELLGIRVAAGAAAASVQIVARNGGATSLESVPFSAALRLLVALGAAPAAIVPLAPPAAPTPTPSPMPIPAAGSNPAPRAATPPPTSESAAHDERMANSPHTVTRQHAAPARTANITRRPAQPSKGTRTSPPAAAVSPRLVDEAPPPTEQMKPADPALATHNHRTASPPQSANAANAAPVVKHAAQAPAKPQEVPASGITKVRELSATSEESSAAPAPAGPAAIAPVASVAPPMPPLSPPAPPPTPSLRPGPPSPVGIAASFWADSPVPQDGSPNEAGTPHVPEWRSEAWDAGVGARAPAPASGDAATVRQAALLLWRAVLAAVALRLAGWRELIAGALGPLGALRRAGMPPQAAAEATHGMPRSRRQIAAPRLAALLAWRTRPQTVIHRVGVRAVAIAASIESTGRDVVRARRPGHALAGVRSPSLLAGRLEGVSARSASARMRAGQWALPGGMLARWRRFALATALCAVALAVAGAALVADSAPVPSAGAAVHRQAEHAPPSRGAIPSAISPIYAGVIYAGTQDGAIYALDAGTGMLLWRYDTGSPVESGPVVAGDMIFAGEGDGSIIAVRAATHHLLWRYRTGGTVRAAPAVMDGVVYAGSSDHWLYALRAGDGTLLWRFAAADQFANTPAVAGDMVYVGSYDGSLYALRAGDGTEVWHLTTPGAVSVAPVVVNGTVYAGSSDDTLYALDARTGAIRWWFTTGGSISTPPMVANGTVYVGSNDTNLYALGASDGRLRWYTHMDGLVPAPAVVADQTVYVTSAGMLYALRASDGTRQWRYVTQTTRVIAPAVASGMVYVSAGGSSVVALGAQDGSVRWSYRTGEHVTSSLIGVSGW